MRLFALSLVLLLAPACSHTKGFLVTGQTLDQLGAQYEVAAPLFFKGCSAGTLPVDTCRKWRDFATQFQHLYRPTVTAWHAAYLTANAAVEKRYADMARPLFEQLDELFGVLVTTGLVKP